MKTKLKITIALLLLMLIATPKAMTSTITIKEEDSKNEKRLKMNNAINFEMQNFAEKKCNNFTIPSDSSWQKLSRNLKQENVYPHKGKHTPSVPEPASIILIGAGLVGLLTTQRKK